MNDESCIAIKILKEVPFFGKGDTLEKRLRKVSLRGFPEIKIYENSNFEFVFLTPEEIITKLHIPQPSIYMTHLDKINSLAKHFLKQKINIFNLDKAYDFIATSKTGQETEWTMLPPVIERFHIPKTNNGKFNYASLIGEKLSKSLKINDLGINPEISKIEYTSKTGFFDEINDGSHRVHYGLETGKGIKILIISEMASGFPYYAVPQKYSTVRIHKERDNSAIETKIHVVDSPGHKHLYRLFPSGGIKSGEIRFDPKLGKNERN